MTFSLSVSSICNSVRAVAAIEMLTASSSDRLQLAPLLDRERPDILRTMIRTAFSSTVIDIIPFVSDMSGADDEESELLSLDLRLPRSVAGRPLRRQLEQIIARHVLESWLLPVSPALAEKFASSRRALLATLLSALISPFVRKPYY